MSGIALSNQSSVQAPRVKKTASRIFALLLLSLTPNGIACQDLDALLARAPGVTERWQPRLFMSPFGTVRAVTFDMQRPLGSAMPRPPAYILLNSDTASLAKLISQQPPSDEPWLPRFPEANRTTKTDLLMSGSREPTSPPFELSVTEPAASPAPLRTHGVASALPPAPTSAAFTTPVLAPIAFVRFCIQYPEDCKIHSHDRDQTPILLTQTRLLELSKINRNINDSIKPKANLGGVVAEAWLVSPSYGDCNDYAVTKRHELLARGWPSRSLLLAEVQLDSGEHHLVLIVRTRDDDLVLDNLNPDVRPISQITYRWIRAQQTDNPRFWSTIKVRRPDRIAMSRSHGGEIH